MKRNIRLDQCIAILRIVLLSILVLTSISSGYYSSLLLPSASASTYVPTLSYNTDEGTPSIISDLTLKVEEVVTGLDLPTTMAFLSPNDILVLEKNKGTVQRIINGTMLPEPLLDVNVATSVERCMCGIAAVSKNSSNIGSTYVFLYFTEAQVTDSEDVIQGKDPLGNRLYRYDLDNNNNKLINPVLLLDLPGTPGPRHNGGAIMVGPDNNIYVPIGDVDGSGMGEASQTKAQNYVNGIEPDGRSGILRITQDGRPVGTSGAAGGVGSSSSGGGIIGDSYPLNLYYAYGIRNSFGFDFDPVTGKLWDTENGPGDGPGEGDEINLVEPGFNSGWQEVHGMASIAIAADNNNDINPNDDLVDFEGKGKYSDPEFAWIETVGPTALKFLNSDNKLGIQYVNDMFVGDVHNGNIYHFDLNEARTDLILGGGLLADKVADSDSELEEAGGGAGIIFGKGFGGITDLEVGPDGYFYVVSIGKGAIYRIVPGVNDVDRSIIDKDDEQGNNDYDIGSEDDDE